MINKILNFCPNLSVNMCFILMYDSVLLIAAVLFCSHTTRRKRVQKSRLWNGPINFMYSKVRSQSSTITELIKYARISREELVFIYITTGMGGELAYNDTNKLFNWLFLRSSL